MILSRRSIPCARTARKISSRSMLKFLTTAHGWRCSLIKPDDPEDMGNPPDSPRLGWVERLIIKLAVPKSHREEFEADLLEEYEEIRREKGVAAAMSWRRDQLLRSVVPLLRRRLERLIPSAVFLYFLPLIPLLRRRVGRLIPLVVFVYFLPVLFLGLLLHGVNIALRSFLDLVGRVKSPASSTPRWIAISVLRSSSLPPIEMSSLTTYVKSSGVSRKLSARKRPSAGSGNRYSAPSSRCSDDGWRRHSKSSDPNMSLPGQSRSPFACTSCPHSLPW